MSQLEIVHLRLTGPCPGDLVKDICESIGGRRALGKVCVYKRKTIDTELAIHLRVDTDQNDSRSSELGIRLASALKEFGMVKHSVWREARFELAKTR